MKKMSSIEHAGHTGRNLVDGEWVRKGVKLPKNFKHKGKKKTRLPGEKRVYFSKMVAGLSNKQYSYMK